MIEVKAAKNSDKTRLQDTFLWPWFSVLAVYLRAIFVFLGIFFVAFIFFGFLLLPSKLSGIVMSPLKVASTLQVHCLPQTTVIEPNFIQEIFLTLSNLKISSSFHLEFERGC